LLTVVLDIAEIVKHYLEKTYIQKTIEKYKRNMKINKIGRNAGFTKIN
jgi:hypothetical protein